VYVPVAEGESIRPGLPRDARLRAAILEKARQAGDAIVIHTDRHGKPIQPDLEAARARGSAVTQAAAAANELTFTFNSPDYPWTAADIAQITTYLNNCYPIAKTIYGPPAFSMTVNIVKAPALGGGSYAYSINEIALGYYSQDLICHEMLHAFHDDIMPQPSTWEEGQARAAEVEILARLGASYWDSHHSYVHDIWYDSLNSPSIAAVNGKWGGFNPLLRYQISGYAWAKVMIENPNFFPSFNAELARRTLLDPQTPYDEAKLRPIAAAAQATVEGRPFLNWYGLQHIFDMPAPGWVVNINPSQFPAIITVFSRYSGFESTRPNELVPWSVYDHTGAQLGGGFTRTNQWGWFDASFPYPSGYTGRLEYRATAGGGAVNVWNERKWACLGDWSGVFGVTLGADTGTLRIRSLDHPGLHVTTPVMNGRFDAPSLESVRGRFEATFDASDSRIKLSRQFTKDSAAYFLLLRATGDMDADGQVTCSDVAALQASLGKRCGEAGYDAAADVNADCVVDHRDQQELSKQLPSGAACK
jgi:hypothetical protein